MRRFEHELENSNNFLGLFSDIPIPQFMGHLLFNLTQICHFSAGNGRQFLLVGIFRIWWKITFAWNGDKSTLSLSHNSCHGNLPRIDNAHEINSARPHKQGTKSAQRVHIPHRERFIKKREKKLIKISFALTRTYVQ